MKRSEYIFRKKQRKRDIKALKQLNYSDDEIEYFINNEFYKLAIHLDIKKQLKFKKEIKNERIWKSTETGRR